jgi:hypothetical protein
MDNNQAKGYLFEIVIQNLLKESGYVKVQSKKIKGRGAEHQIDAYGLLSIPTPFIYPIRLICEAKNYNRKISLNYIRDFVGVIKDISENYVKRKNSRLERCTDSGCYFSFKGFTKNAQGYAWAQNIFLVPFRDIDFLNQIENILDNFLPLVNNNISKKELTKKFKVHWKRKQKDISTSFIVGVLNKKYPVIITGRKELINKMKEELPQDTDLLQATKSNREENRYDTVFKINLSNFFEEVKMTIPNYVANKIINKIEVMKPGSKIFSIDVPFISSRNIRRFLTINVSLPDNEKEEYLEYLKSFISND